LLASAWYRALAQQVDVWTFAVEIGRLHAAGLTDTDLWWLATLGYIDFATETTPTEWNQRTFRQDGPHYLTPKIGVILTEAGAAFAGQRHFSGPRDNVRLGGTPARKDLESRPSDLPFYDKAAREFWGRKLLIKRFRQKGRDQETILAAFEEQEWPPRIDDPLPGRNGLNRQRHLRDTTDNLNRNQQHRLIKFMGDGTGQGVLWDWHRRATVGLR